jgi:hypothetical protein
MKILFICIICLMFSTSLTMASDYRFGLGAGVFDSLEHMKVFTGSLTVEGKPFTSVWDLRPTVQFLAIENSGYYLGAGLLKDFSINPSWSYGLGFSAGAAHESRASGALEYDVEFYSRIFLNRQVDENNSLRLEFGHISNGGLDEKNPGTEPLLLFWVRRF